MNKIVFQTLAMIFLLNFTIPVIAQQGSSYTPDNFLKNGVIAHRGAWKKDSLPQNSIASLQNAIRLGVAGSEFDVQLTADEVLVVNHDPIFQGMNIEITDYSILANNLLKNGETLPTLENYLKTGMTQNKTRLILELKPSKISKERSLLLAQKVVEKVNQMKAQEWMIYISFDYDILKKILRLDPAAKTMYLGGNVSPAQLKADGISGADYHLNVFKKDDQWISNAHKIGIQTNVWTVNDSLMMDYFLARNIDYITTNEPEILLRKVNGNIHNSAWKLIWNEEFSYTGLPDSTKWNYDTHGNSYGWGNNEAQWYTVGNLQNTQVSDGTLKIIARQEPTSDKKYSSGRLTTKSKGDWKYGKVEVRAKLPSGNGTWSAIWMLSSDNSYGGWPKSGEIDIMEQVGYDPDTIHSTVHTEKYNHVKGTQVGKAIAVKTASAQFHVYTTEWDENEIRSYVDGIFYFSFQKENSGFDAWPFDQPFHLILNLAIGGDWGGKHGIDNSKFPHVFEIDYVRVFEAKQTKNH
ncbi:MAG TPA: family 16 glycosylhydrolase [Prolixibacteraceae bacterium]|nr:family 16 glycosylhydrolase [Prolixibacteraceae bacterium]